MNESAFFSDADYELWNKAAEPCWARIEEALLYKRVVVFPKAGIGTGLAELPVRAPRIMAEIERTISQLTLSGVRVPPPGEQQTGRKASSAAPLHDGGIPSKIAGAASAKNDGEIDGNFVDRERIYRVVQRLAERANAATGEYVQYFADRAALARIWQDDLSRGVPLSPDRREGLLDMECTADPQLGGKPYRIHVSKGGRLEEVNLRVLKGKAGYFIGTVGGAVGPAYSRLSKGTWTGQAAAETALKHNAWTSAQQNKSQQRGR